MSTTDKMVRYRLPGDKLIRTCPERLTRTNGFRIQGGVVLQEMQPISLPKMMETFVEEIEEEISNVPEVKRRGRKPKQ
jgi:hypothetical protein